MSAIRQCYQCRGNIVEPAFEGDGVYPVSPMCTCDPAARAFNEGENRYRQTVLSQGPLPGYRKVERTERGR